MLRNLVSERTLDGTSFGPHPDTFLGNATKALVLDTFGYTAKPLYVGGLFAEISTGYPAQLPPEATNLQTAYGVQIHQLTQ